MGSFPEMWGNQSNDVPGSDRIYIYTELQGESASVGWEAVYPIPQSL